MRTLVLDEYVFASAKSGREGSRHYILPSMPLSAYLDICDRTPWIQFTRPFIVDSETGPEVYRCRVSYSDGYKRAIREHSECFKTTDEIRVINELRSIRFFRRLDAEEDE